MSARQHKLKRLQVRRKAFAFDLLKTADLVPRGKAALALKIARWAV